LNFHEEKQHRFLSLVNLGVPEDEAAERTEVALAQFQLASQTDGAFSDKWDLARKGKYDTSGFKQKVNQIVRKTGEEIKSQFRAAMVNVGFFDDLIEDMKSIEGHDEKARRERREYQKLLMPFLIPKESHLQTTEVPDEKMLDEDVILEEIDETRRKRLAINQLRDDTIAARRKHSGLASAGE